MRHEVKEILRRDDLKEVIDAMFYLERHIKPYVSYDASMRKKFLFCSVLGSSGGAALYAAKGQKIKCVDIKRHQPKPNCPKSEDYFDNVDLLKLNGVYTVELNQFYGDCVYRVLLQEFNNDGFWPLRFEMADGEMPDPEEAIRLYGEDEFIRDFNDAVLFMESIEREKRLQTVSFRKSDLHSGDILELRNGRKAVVVMDLEEIVYSDYGANGLEVYNDELLKDGSNYDLNENKDYDVMKVYRSRIPGICIGFNETRKAEVVFERVEKQ